TQYLYQQIRTDSLNRDGSENEELKSPRRSSLSEILARLTRLQLFLGSAQKRIQREIKAVELELKSSKH
ncbi:MAG TPA: hypothetical protein VGJ37_07050, partial [Pyrinomonadaceae bacterium]